MRRYGLILLLTAAFGGPVVAQDYTGASSFGSSETLFRYDDLEPWKHGYRKQMPYHEGFHAFRPYNYHHVFGQTQTAAAYGQSMPYSQQWWHRYQSVSSQYNHLQGQPPMAMPQYNGPAAPPAAAPPATEYTMPPAHMGMEMMAPPVSMPMETMAVPSIPAPLMPVN